MAGAMERFRAAALERGLAAEVRRFPEGTKTAAEAARAVGCELGQIVKSLVFVADGRPVVALTSGANRADTRRLGEELGADEVRRATPEEARRGTGFAIGGTPPFGYPEPLDVLIDEALMGYETVWAAAGTPDAVFALSPHDLARASGGRVADFSERA